MCCLKTIPQGGQRKKARFTQDSVNVCQMVKKSHTSTNNLIYHCAPDSTGVINLPLSSLTQTHKHTHIYIPHYTGRQQITPPTASTLNSPKASFTSKQGLSDLTLEGRQQPTLFFHLARRQEHRWINNTTQPRGAARASTTSLLLKYFSIW